jgi:ubiquinone/menaquinone biosynthesis C-methylase UbiE
MLSVGCGRALIDYWLVRVLGVDAHLLDLSAPVLRKVHRSFGRTPHHTYHHDARTLPFRDGQFDVVWNAGVWEHFPEDEIISGVAEMGRVSRGFVLVLVPYSECKPYMLAKKWLEDHGLWSYGDEYPKKTLRPYFEAAGMTVVDESLLGGEAICRGYVGSISDPEARSAVASQLQPEDFAVWPYLVTTATGLHPEARRTA